MIVVHYRADHDALSAPCGYVFIKSLAGLDYAMTWGKNVPHPVTCPECRLKGPKVGKLRQRQWEDVARGRKTRP